MKFFVLLLLLFACATYRVIETSHKIQPNWMKNPYWETEEAIFSVGVRTKVARLEDGIAGARAEAAKKVVETYFGVKVKAEYEDIMKQVGKSFEEKFSATMKAKAKGEIFGAREIEIYYKKYMERGEHFYDVWVLLGVKKSLIEEALKKYAENLRKLIEIVKGEIDKVDTLVLEGKYRAVIDELKSYLKELSDYKGNPDVEVVIASVSTKIREIKLMRRTIGVFVGIEAREPLDANVLTDALIELLTDKKFIVKEINLNYEDLGRVLGKDMKKIREIARDNVIMLLAVGKVKVEQTESASGYFMFSRAKGNIEIIDATNGEVIFSVVFNEKGAGLDFKRSAISAINEARKVLIKELRIISLPE